MKIPDQRIRIPQGVLEIDGSQGEGGGQILRTACALSSLTGIACRIRQIRAGRRKPGLRAQHCTALKGLARMCSAQTSPLKVGSREVSFRPRSLQKTKIDLDTGTAGSASLVLQALLLAALGSPSKEVHFILRGGTDVPGAPSCDFMKNVKLEVLQRMGYRVDLRILRRGYYPKGGGILDVRAHPPGADLLEPLQIPLATDPLGSYGISHAAESLAKRHVAEKQSRAATKMLTNYMHVPARVDVEYGATPSSGSGVVVWAKTAETVWGASALGRSDKSSEEVAEEAADKLLRTYHTRASFDPWLGDQILPYMALSRGPSVISVPRLTRHMKTNMWLVQQFLNVRFYCELKEQRVLVHCSEK